MIFDIAFAFAVSVEGGHSNDPQDPGGETKFGISKKSFPSLDIAALTIDDAKKIYKKDYWDIHSLDALPPDVALCVFDAAVNQGGGAAVEMLQDALRMVNTDGVMGAKTIAACKSMAPSYIVQEFIVRRFHRYVLTANYSTYGRGWSARLVKLARVAQAVRNLYNELK